MKKFVLCCAFLFATVGCSKKSEKWDIVIHARGGQIENTRLMLDDIDEYVSVFTVGKPRMAILVSVQDIVSVWDELFACSEPNATLSMRTAQKEQKQQVVILKNPQLIDGKLLFTIEQKYSDLKSEISEVVLFVDGGACPKCGSWCCNNLGPGHGCVNCP